MRADDEHDSLLRAAREAEKPLSRRYVDIVQVIRADHLTAGGEAIDKPDILQSYETSVNNECDSLVKILEAAQHLGEVSSRTEDKIIAKGERLSCMYMTGVLQARGVNAVLVD